MRNSSAAPRSVKWLAWLACAMKMYVAARFANLLIISPTSIMSRMLASV